MNTESWNVVKNFTGELLIHKTTYYGAAAEQIGLVPFDIGVIESGYIFSKLFCLASSLPTWQMTCGNGWIDSQV